MPFSIGPTIKTEVGTRGSAASKVLNTAQMGALDTHVTFSWQVLAYLAPSCSDQADLRIYSGASAGAFTNLIDSFSATISSGLITKTYDLTTYASTWITMFFQSPFAAPCLTTVAGSMATGDLPIQGSNVSILLGCDVCAKLQAILDSVQRVY